jgi:uncharacterized heparinase superfamily protein
VSAKIFELFSQLKHDHRDRMTLSAARGARRGKTAKAFVSQPEPHGIGSAQKGLQLAAGNFLVDGRLIVEPEYSIWKVESDNIYFQRRAHSFSWLDHMAANNSDLCKSKSRRWFSEWFEYYGDGDNAAWMPDLAGARIIRMINHALLLLGNSNELDPEKYFTSISHHARFVKKRWQYAPDGLPKFQALVGYVYSALALEEFSGDLKPAVQALGQECDAAIAQDGGILSRNPEELLDIFTLLVWVNQGLDSADFKSNRSLLTAIERISPAIRTLRMGDRKLVEFHGGRASNAQRIDQILSHTGGYATSTNNSTMGYSRISNEDSVVVMDAGAETFSHDKDQSSGCALAFEFSSAAQIIVRSVGASRNFDDAKMNAGQRTADFSVASIPSLDRVETEVSLLREENNYESASILEACHSGYIKSCGLQYTRLLELSANGRVLSGTDRFSCQNNKGKITFDAGASNRERGDVLIVQRFHIDADIEVELDLGGAAISLQLPNDEIWIFKASVSLLTLEDSLHFVSDRLKPRATKQIVVTSRVVNYEGAVNWMLTRLED